MTTEVVFTGVNPLTGMAGYCVFKELNQTNTRLLMWNKLLNKWMHSKDAGLTWKSWHGICEDIIEDTDLVIYGGRQ